MVLSLLWFVTAPTYREERERSGGACALIDGICAQTEVLEKSWSLHGGASGVGRSGTPQPSAVIEAKAINGTMRLFT
jgi:hypothetical protein